MYCQKCRAPLKLHGSIESLNPASFHLLADQPTPPDGPTSPSRNIYSQQQKQLYNAASKNSQTPVFKQRTGHAPDDRDATPEPPSPTAGRDRGGMSFINITDSQVVAPSIAHRANPENRQAPRPGRSRQGNRQEASSDEVGQLSRKMETSANLFDILSSRSDIDHPVCSECTDMLVEQMEKRLVSAAKERDAYIDFLKNANADAPTAEEAAQTRAELKATKEREAAALRELEELEREKAALEEEIAALDQESKDLDAEEEAFWREHNAFTTTLAAFQNERDSINLRYDHDARLLERLQRTDVYTDAFHISYDGSFGTINGLRLGRLSRPEVEWAEVNAAWGMALLLLDTLADKLQFAFRGFRLHPCGSTSKIEKLPASEASPGEMLPLHRSDTPLNLTWMHKGFDAAMVAFLECMRQLGAHVEARAAQRGRDGADVKMPYDIAKDRINDCSIKSMGFVNDENWTKACKHALTYCKFLMAYTRNIKPPRGEDGAG